MLWFGIIGGVVALFVAGNIYLGRCEAKEIAEAGGHVQRAREAMARSAADEAAVAAARGLIIPSDGKFRTAEDARAVGEAAAILAEALEKLEVPLPELLVPIRVACERAAAADGKARKVPDGLDEPAGQLRSRLSEGAEVTKAVRAFRKEELGEVLKGWSKRLAEAPIEGTLEESLALVDALLEGSSFGWSAVLMLRKASIVRAMGRSPDEVIRLVEGSAAKGLALSGEENDALAEEQLRLLRDAYRDAGRTEDAERAEADLKKRWIAQGMAGGDDD
jgi:hypothetical protein